MLRELKRIKTRAGRSIKETPIQFSLDAWSSKKKLRASESMNIQEEIVEGILEIKEKKADISMMQLVAICARRSGDGKIDRKEMLNYLGALRQLCIYGVITPGMDFSGLSSMISENLHIDIEDYLYSKPVARSTGELIRELSEETVGPGVSKRHKMLQNRYNLILNLKLLLGDIDRLPSNSEIGNNAAMWISNAHRGTAASIPTWNIGYNTLRTLEDGAMTKMDLMSSPRLTRILVGKPSIVENRVFRNALEPCLDSLWKQELVKVNTETRKEKFGRAPQILSLTPMASEFLTYINLYNMLPEGLQLALMGHKSSGLNLVEERRLLSFIKAIKVMKAIEKYPDLGNERIAKLVGETNSYVSHILYDKIYPWKNKTVSTKALKERYLPEMKERFPEYCKWLIDHLAKTDDEPMLPLFEEAKKEEKTE